MKNMRILIIILPLLVGSCRISHVMQSAEPKSASAQSIRWDTHSTFDDRSGPVGSISLVLGSAAVPLRTDRPVAFKPLDREQQAVWAGVPNQAVIAALGWHAGYGEVLYAVSTQDEVLVYCREVEEQLPPSPFKIIKRIPLQK